MKYLFPILLLLMAACSQPKIEVVTSTELEPWVVGGLAKTTSSKENLDVQIVRADTLQTIDGFGTCFNELGWMSLQRLSQEDRDGILQELFQPGVGANFTICRMPVAANDFAEKWYSYDETEGDFEMKDFSIANDKKTLMPFIQNAQKYNPKLKIWASPWSPPQWMKYNKHYAAKSLMGDSIKISDKNGKDITLIGNGLPLDREGKEGTDMFIQESDYYKAYALYFAKFIEAYRKEGIDIFMVMPQNEFNSAQVFPSCTWTAKGLTTFVGQYLGPAMKELNVDVMFGTMERGNEALVDTVLTDVDAKKFVSGVGFQWAGKESIPGIHKRYPDLTLYQTEQECGNGKNDWSKCVYSWGLMKHYLSNGANAYMYWNTSLDAGGISTWGWQQNSLVSVDTTDNTFQYNHEYYLLKHVSHYVQKGAKLLRTTGSFDNMLAFKNPDDSIILVMQNELKENRQLSLKLDGTYISVDLKPDSFTTLKVE
ncbi:beta-glycosidase [Maribacter sp. ANRC-HE7]|uniref:Beta-glycosidase n=1 Tax=Maribacter aquimaris TaxID=2737171 RepID=A0ABR7UW47_9FLAO|nr:glycoside hydrolase family 30 beta sandwich domain-containing protein [Maribacter aquimaris]MBD0776291.1 beta-glycosidase [Maribacter aquimaris]